MEEGQFFWSGSLDFAFRGENKHKIDQKGRVSVPADFRRGIIGGDPDHQPGATHAAFTIVYGDHRLACLKCYTETAIREIDEAIGQMNLASEERRFLEFFYQTKSFKAQLDPSGRFILPKNLKDKVNIGTEVWFAGTGASFELWSAQIYHEHCQKLENQFFGKGAESFDPLQLLDAEL